MAESTGIPAFRTFAVDPPYAARTIRSQLLKKKIDLVAQLGDGYAKDWADYCRRVGVIEGLSDAVGICEDMEKQERNG